jgi:hypothetical protein
MNNPPRPARKTAHPWRYLLRMWPRSSCMRMTDLEDGRLWSRVAFRGFRSRSMAALGHASSCVVSGGDWVASRGKSISVRKHSSACLCPLCCSILVCIGALFKHRTRLFFGHLFRVHQAPSPLDPSAPVKHRSAHRPRPLLLTSIAQRCGCCLEYTSYCDPNRTA